MSDSRQIPTLVQLFNIDESSVDSDDDDPPYCYCCGESVTVVGVCTYCANNCPSGNGRTPMRVECTKTGAVDPLGVRDSVLD